MVEKIKRKKSIELKRLNQIIETLELTNNRLTSLEMFVDSLNTKYGDVEKLKARLTEQAQINRHLNAVVSELLEKEKKNSSNQNNINITLTK